MKRISILVFLSLISFKGISQEIKQNTQNEIDPRIVEVFGDQLENLVLNDKDRLNGLNLLLQKRVKIEYKEYSPDEKYDKLSAMPLFNSYNKELKRDEVFEPSSFNVLKYNLNFFSQSFDSHYRVDDTNFIIRILPQYLKEDK